MISFQNDGLIDIRAITTFGVSSKEKENAIGFFGTGLKYAVAICLRHGHKVTLHIGLDKYEFTTRQERIRVNDFNLVYMNERELGFTTELGKTWKMWQAFRELYCNAMDEQDPIVTDQGLLPAEGKTTFQVEGFDMDHAYTHKDEIILTDKPDWIVDGVHIHNKPGRNFYYRGIKVGDMEDSGIHTYNIVGHQIQLTEDRTLLHSWEPKVRIRYAVASCKFLDLIEKTVTAPAQSFESLLDFDGTYPKEQFLEVMARLPFKIVTNQSAIKVYKKCTQKVVGPTNLILTEIEKQQLEKAHHFLSLIGFDTRQDPIIITNDLSEGVLGMMRDNKIYLSKRAFMMGTKYVAGTLMEEHIHLHEKLTDESRPLQNYLIDLVMSLGERVVGEPL